VKTLENGFPSGEQRVSAQRHVPHGNLMSSSLRLTTHGAHECAGVYAKEFRETQPVFWLRRRSTLLPSVDATRRDADSFSQGFLGQAQLDPLFAEELGRCVDARMIARLRRL
jgi:hypothetical protein